MRVQGIYLGGLLAKTRLMDNERALCKLMSGGQGQVKTLQCPHTVNGMLTFSVLDWYLYMHETLHQFCRDITGLSGPLNHEAGAANSLDMSV